MTVLAMAPPRAGDPTDEEIVRLAGAVLADARAWAVVGCADLDPRLRRAVCVRAVRLLEEALETV